MSQSPEKTVAIFVAVALLIGVGATSSLFWDRGGEPGEEVTRREAPELSVPLLSGVDFELSKERGKTVILDFWATWCSPCEVQMPILDSIFKARGGRELTIVGVSVDTDPASAVEAWIEERGFEYPIGLGDQDLAMRFGVRGFPTLIVIDPNGAIRTQHVGILSRPDLEDLLDEIAQEAPSRG